MNLGIPDFTYDDLYSYARLSDLSREFDRFVEAHDAELFRRFDADRTGGASLSTPEEAELLIAVSRELGLFLAQLFPIGGGVDDLRAVAKRDAEVARFKKEFVAKRVAKIQNPVVSDSATLAELQNDPDPELALARRVNQLLDVEKQTPGAAREEIEALANAVAAQRKAGRFAGWTSFRLPQPMVFDRLVPTEPAGDHAFGGPHHHFRRRDAFHLTDARMTPREISDEAHYCIYCHERNKDSCSKGFPQPNGTFKPNPLGMALEGCPLDERIGEMNVLRAGGDAIAALAMVMIDNPMCPGTGHRICNDCMRGCIFQKQDPVNIPQIETGVLTDVLFLPWGFEIYSLLTRWNPINKRRPMALPYNGKNVLVVGLGPAGYTLAHYLANEGFGVVAIDGLKIEPLTSSQLSAGSSQERSQLSAGSSQERNQRNGAGGSPANCQLPTANSFEGGGSPESRELRAASREAIPNQPTPDPGSPASCQLRAASCIKDARTLWDDLDDRILAGFGGVSEYGITVRWDKNFLKVMRIALERKENLRMYGGVRFGGTLTIEEAFDELGFDHIAIAAGAGTPTIVRMKNNLVRGMRQASDFLMALQLTGAFKKNSLANLQVRLPAVVIGGGLTAIDTATELFAYYPVQVEKVLERYETLCSSLDEARVRGGYDAEELSILDEMLAHGRAIRAERERAASAGEEPNFLPLVRGWGGVTIAYRKSMNDSPAYRLNFEEINKAFEEGIAYAEMLSPSKRSPMTTDT